MATDKVVSSYSLEFCVIADNRSQGPLTIRQTSGLPLVNVTTYAYGGESDTTAICKRKSAKQETKNPLVWMVRCDFDNDPNSRSDDDEQNQPGATNRPPIITWDAEYGEKRMDKDYSSPRKAVVNTVGDVFDPPPTRPIVYPVLTIRRYQTTFTPATILAFVNKVNQDEFYGADPGAALMAAIRAQQVIEDSVKLWQVEYRIRFDVIDKHKLELMSAGPRYRETAGGPLIRTGGWIENLKADGTKAAAGDEAYVEFKPFQTADFDSLNLE
jgi:hypothetical protein